MLQKIPKPRQQLDQLGTTANWALNSQSELEEDSSFQQMQASPTLKSNLIKTSRKLEGAYDTKDHHLTIDSQKR